MQSTCLIAELRQYIYEASSDITIENTNVRKSERNGLYIENCDMDFTNNEISHCDGNAIYMKIVDGKTSDFTGTTVTNNTVNGITIFGHITGTAVLNAYGLPYVMYDTPSVREGASLRINPGNVIKFYEHGTYGAKKKLTVYGGKLTVAGTVRN